MKKFITFNNVLALLAVIIIPLLAVPCFYVNTPEYTTNKDCFVNFFTRAFGGYYYPNSVELETRKIFANGQGFPLYANGGLITAFALLIAGVVCLILVNFFKKGANWFKFAGASCLIASGILFCCALNLAYIGRTPVTDRFSLTGATIAYGVILIVIGSFSLISILFRKKSQPIEGLDLKSNN